MSRDYRRPRLTAWDVCTWVFVVLFYAVIFFGTVTVARPDDRTDPAWATVRIFSHGASGTIIKSKKGMSWILSCAHMFPDKESLRRPLHIDGPEQTSAGNQLVKAKLLAYDMHLDLSLIELPNGPFHCIPVAPKGHRPSDTLLSLGYDEMKWPVTRKQAKFLGSQGNTTYTRERPWHGRSGGGLIDPRTNQLVGVVQGYEVAGLQRGLYVSHEAILRFLDRYRAGAKRDESMPHFYRPIYDQHCPIPGGT